jgi:PfaD family protein
LGEIERSYLVLEKEGKIALATGGRVDWGSTEEGGYAVLGVLPPQRIEALGDPSFCRDYGIRYPYIAGAMANGIASVALVEAISRAGMLGFFGAAGLSTRHIEQELSTLQKSLTTPFGMNLIHSPGEPRLEAETVALYLGRGVRWIEASAYMDLTLPLIRFRVAGIHRAPTGEIVTPHRVMGKVSRVEVARRFFSPPPPAILQSLVAEGFLTPEQAELARQIPVAQDLTAEADSGGHTDNRPALTLFPTLLALRDELQAQYGYSQALRVGAAGGIGTPQAAAAMFAMGAAYIVTGSINQACIEAGTSPIVKQMLAQTEQADVIMAPAADMFEMGVKVQVLKRGTMFAMRAAKLYSLYRSYNSLDALPTAEREALERQFFQAPLSQIWEKTAAYFLERDPSQVERAEADPHHKMALVFRWYLGLSSRWANLGDPARKMDYQIWCGAAMGAFNAWTKGTPLATPEARRVVDVAHNLLYGAAYEIRLHLARQQGLGALAATLHAKPMTRAALERYFLH